MNKSESEILADVYEKVRDLSKFYLSSLSDIDIDKRIEADGIKFNSAYWIAAHLVWTEHSLILNGVAGDDMNIDWLNDYAYGCDPDKIKNKPPIEEVLKTMDEVHEKAVSVIRNHTDEQLDEDNLFGESFSGSKSKRNLIIHAIRHEPMHIGQLSWILKYGGFTFA
ncbi:MAG TPA: DinB family protein [Ignavibacteria bacterium]|nr:DinB family protein [Ignavibacteria bacterium]HMR40645.1 DinB family protein [Ignavibacteria bacterium]